MRIDFALRLRKINRHPENGSALSFSRQSCARESMPFLPSMASICHQDAELWRDLDQAIISHNPRPKVASSAVVPFHSIRIVPRCPSNSMMHVGATAACRVISSTNAGIARLFRTVGPPGSAIRLR